MAPKEKPTHENVYGVDQQLIARVPIVYEDGSAHGYSCDPEAIRAILLDSNLFLSEEVEGWDETVFVPMGLIPDSIVTYAIDYGGLTHRAWFLGPPGGRLTSPLNLRDDRAYHKYTGWARNGKMVKDEDREEEERIYSDFQAGL